MGKDTSSGKPKRAAKPAKKAAASKRASAPKKLGRPSSYSQEIADEICERMADGESLRSICLEERMPNRTTVFRWLDAHSDFCSQYARARESFVESLVDDTLPIADDGRNDTYLDENGNKRTDHDVIARAKLRIETRKWIASKLAPRKYGDKLDVNHGGQKDNPLTMLLEQVQGTPLRPKPN